MILILDWPVTFGPGAGGRHRGVIVAAVILWPDTPLSPLILCRAFDACAVMRFCLRLRGRNGGGSPHLPVEGWPDQGQSRPAIDGMRATIPGVCLGARPNRTFPVRRNRMTFVFSSQLSTGGRPLRQALGAGRTCPCPTRSAPPQRFPRHWARPDGATDLLVRHAVVGRS